MKGLKMGSRGFGILPVFADTVIRKFRGNFHCHNHAELWYVLKGEMRHTIGGREYLQTAGTFSFVRAYTPHLTDTTVSDETPVIFSSTADEKALLARGYDCFLRHSALASLEGKEIPEFAVLSGRQKAEADAAARELLNEDFRKSPDSPDRRCRLFIEFLRIITRDEPSLRITRSLREKTHHIIDAADYIAMHCKEKLPLDMLCERALMSKRRFTDNFKSVIGMTAGELQTLHRMYHADQLLCFTEKTLEEIAAEIGYFDKSNFSHTFKAHFGITPSEYRRKTSVASYKWESGERLKRKRRWETLNYYYSLTHDGKQLPKSSVSNMPNLLDE